MALISVPFFPQDGTITIEDATGTPISLTVQYEDGDFSCDGWKEDHSADVVVRDRRRIYAVRKGDEEPMTFSFTAHATDMADGTEKTILDAVMKTGAFASGVSTWGANADVWTLKVTWTGEQTDFGGGADSTIVFDYCRLDASFAEGQPATFTVNGTAYLKAASGIART
jgi:hypothetical protein